MRATPKNPKTRNNEAPVILTIDGATTTGYALRKNGATTYGHWKFKETNRNYYLFTHIDEMIIKHGVTHLVAEDIHLDTSRAQAFKVLAELRGSIKAAAQKHNITLTFVTPKAVREHLFATEIKQAKRTCAQFNALTQSKTSIQQIGRAHV